MTRGLVPLAEIVRPHGLRGEVKALPLADVSPTRLEALGECWLWESASGARQASRIRRCRAQGGAVILALESVSSVAEAEVLVGRLVAVSEDALEPLPRGVFYASTLIGARVVTEAGTEVGELVGAEAAPGHDLWVVRAGAREHLIPAVAEIVRHVDLAARRVTIRPPEGLLELAT